MRIKYNNKENFEYFSLIEIVLNKFVSILGNEVEITNSSLINNEHLILDIISNLNKQKLGLKIKNISKKNINDVSLELFTFGEKIKVENYKIIYSDLFKSNVLNKESEIYFIEEDVLMIKQTLDNHAIYRLEKGKNVIMIETIFDKNIIEILLSLANLDLISIYNALKQKNDDFVKNLSIEIKNKDISENLIICNNIPSKYVKNYVNTDDVNLTLLYNNNEINVSAFNNNEINGINVVNEVEESINKVKYLTNK